MRSGRGGDAQTTEAATVDQESPEFVGNISLHHLISDYTFIEAKLAYFTGYYDLVPHSGPDISGHVDAFTGDNTINSAWFYRGDRSRLQTNASVTPGSFARLNACRLNSALYRFLLAITHLQAHYRA